MHHKRNVKILFIGVTLMLVFMLVPVSAQHNDSPISKAGPYQVGVRVMDFFDASRDNRKLQTYIWYPAHVTKDGPRPALPDNSGAPYPLVIYSHGWTNSPGDNISTPFINHLVSQGYVVAAVDHRDRQEKWPPVHNFVDRPFDVLYVLNQLSKLGDGPLVGMISTDKIGIIGYSLGAYTSLTLAGAHIDPSHLRSWCKDSPEKSDFDYCKYISIWGQITDYRKTIVPTTLDGSWSATTDERIKAILSIAPCGGPFWGEKGLASIKVPALLVGGTADINCPYDVDASYIYDHLSSDRYLVTLEATNHANVPDTALINYYETALFGYYVQGKTNYAQYLTADSANAFPKATLISDRGS